MKSFSQAVGLILAVATVALGAQDAELMHTSPVSGEQGYVLSVDVELVNVTATVLDESGRYLEGLTAEDFQILEDAREQRISFFSHDSRVPISIGMLVDTSGSHQDKLRQALQTAKEIAATLSTEDEMFVITFDSRAKVRQKFTNNLDEVQRSLRDIRGGGETAVFDAISLGLNEMLEAKHDKRVLLLLSDGFDTRSKIKAAQAEDLLRRSDVLLYAIGIDDDVNDPRMRGRPRYRIYDYMLGKLTGATGGRLIRLYTGREYNFRSLAQGMLENCIRSTPWATIRPPVRVVQRGGPSRFAL